MYFFIPISHFPDPCPVRSGTEAVNRNDAEKDDVVNKFTSETQALRLTLRMVLTLQKSLSTRALLDILSSFSRC